MWKNWCREFLLCLLQKVDSDSLQGVETTKFCQNIENRFQFNVKKPDIQQTMRF